MATITSILPSELLNRIFSLLPDRSDLSSCRQVSRAFKEHSSPYLITTVVFAKRLKAIARLQEILDHPYFHKHVTELFYDASWYKAQTAYGETEYMSACESSPRYFHSHRYEEITAKDDRLFQEIYRAEVPADDAEQVLASEAMRKPANDSRLQTLWATGAHESMEDYNRKFEAQRRIEVAGLPRRIVERCLDRLPSLKRIVFSDWRGLSQSGESYDECARRLFGNTLHPRPASRLELEVERRKCVGEFYELVAAVANHPGGANITSFAIGSHPFEEWCGDLYSSHPGEKVAIDVPANLDIPANPYTAEAGEAMEKMVARLQDLSLHINVLNLGEYPCPKSLTWNSRILASGHKLTHLTLKLTPVVSNAVWSPICVNSPRTQFLSALLPGKHFPALESLHLEGWPRATYLLKEFLAAHASTLRLLRLNSCQLIDTPWELAVWMGQNLRLDGVDLQSGYGGGEDVDVVPVELWKAMEEALPGLCSPVLRLEFLALNGRRNHMNRGGMTGDADQGIRGYSKIRD